MSMTSDERREVAERLREAAIDDGHVGRPYGEQGFQVTLRRIIGTSNPMRPTLYARLAGLIDPTCHLVSTTLQTWTDGSRAFYHELSCGHTCNTVWAKPPKYCPDCGARVVDKDAD